jgi:hypothetical protein
MSREDPQMKLRLPADLKERVQFAAQQANQSLNALILSVLEREFPHPSVNLHEIAMFLEMISEDTRDKSFIAAVNDGLALAANPWRVEVDDGRVVFYPVPNKAEREALARRLVEKGLKES